jgi:hypothetical protein
MIFPSEAELDQGIQDILLNDTRGRSLQHLSIFAMQVMLNGMNNIQRAFPEIDDAQASRRYLTSELKEAFDVCTEFAPGSRVEVSDEAYYLLQDSMSNFFTVRRLQPRQKMSGSVFTAAAIDMPSETRLESMIGQQIQLGGDTLPNAPALFIQDLNFITDTGKIHPLNPQYRALFPLSIAGRHPRVAVPVEANAFVVN